MGIAGYCTVQEAIRLAYDEFSVTVTGQTITSWLRDGKVSGYQAANVWLVNMNSFRKWLSGWSR